MSATNFRLLYLTADGLLEPLGFSQVVRVLEGLAARGWSYKVISLEKPEDLARPDRVDAVRNRLSSSGIEWHAMAYAVGGGAKAAAVNELSLCRAAIEEARTGRFSGIHARSYHGAFAALAAKVVTGTPYLFDTRSYWFDERLEEGRWFTTPVRLGAARGIEHQLFANAAGVVTLTELQAADVRGRLGARQGRVVACITTSADFDEFRPRTANERLSVPDSVRARVAGKLVLGIVGSLNRSYLVDETLRLAAFALDSNQNAHLLVLSAQGLEYERRLSLLNVDPSRYTIARADHEAMPQWLSFIQWGLLLLQPNSPAKRASMPTKLAEFLATGIRPIQFGCNSEVAEWVRRTGSGFVLPDVTDSSLHLAAERIGLPEWMPEQLANAREVARDHFALASALSRYDEVLRLAFRLAVSQPSGRDSQSLSGDHVVE